MKKISILYKNILNGDMTIPIFKLGDTSNDAVNKFLKYEKEFKRKWYKKQTKAVLMAKGLRQKEIPSSVRIYYVDTNDKVNMYHFLLFALAKLTISYNSANFYYKRTDLEWIDDSRIQYSLIALQYNTIKDAYEYYLDKYKEFIEDNLYD